MKVITIMQPFATLIAIGVKHYETRSWPTKYRGELLIHAGKGIDYLYLCYKEPFKSILKHYGYNDMSDLPIGKIIEAIRTFKDRIEHYTVQVVEYDTKRFQEYGSHTWYEDIPLVTDIE